MNPYDCRTPRHPKLALLGLFLGILGTMGGGWSSCIASYELSPWLQLLTWKILFHITPFAPTVENVVERNAVYEPVVYAAIPKFSYSRR